LIYSIAKTPAREDSFHWIGPVAVFHLGFVTNRYREDIKIQSLEDARQYKIAVQRGDIAEGTLKALGFNFVQTSDIEKSYELLVTNRVDLVIDDPRYIKTMASELNLPADHFTFLYDVEALSVKGYLATNNQLPLAIVERLRSAFTKISKTEAYRRVLEL
jgi:polar amino acid transport system substrate-binding protein